MSKQIRPIRALAPEDIRIGDYVAVTQIVVEIPSFLWSDCAIGDRSQPVRMPWTPWDSGEPQRVIDVCLPFVFVKGPDGSHSTLDTRRHRLARMSKRYARTALKRMAKDRKRDSKTESDAMTC